jgi:phosphatidylserine decarboxylase
VQTKKTKGRMGVKRANVLKLLPSRLASRIYGQVNSLPIPYHLRHLAYTSWAMAFKAKLDEVPLPLTAYPSLVSFFTRKLKPGVRPVDDKAAIVSPADSAVVSTSSDLMGTGILRQVKGFDFRVEDFLGMNAPPKVTTPGNVLHSIVLYLSPGDYHRFHSPTEWTVESRTHIAGQLLPVNPIVAHLLPSLLCTNERVALMGKWHHG